MFNKEEIIRIDPKDIGLYIEEETGGNPLTGNKLKALHKLLAFKRNIPKGSPVPESMIQQFLNEDTQINKVIDETKSKMIQENKQQTKNELQILDTQRGIDSLNNRMPQSVTKDESMKRKWTNPHFLQRLENSMLSVSLSFHKLSLALSIEIISLHFFQKCLGF